jgi:hypothetical protein
MSEIDPKRTFGRDYFRMFGERQQRPACPVTGRVTVNDGADPRGTEGEPEAEAGEYDLGLRASGRALLLATANAPFTSTNSADQAQRGA